ncbi:hypothetical protein RB653_007613 [Dictyostelium firmibasis]|uniref:Uncharacterized protein n=1 Tax=Dictyostelium firmibasis TaxID=79012 RepID=A0AAN7YM65_9MYCE
MAKRGCCHRKKVNHKGCLVSGIFLTVIGAVLFILAFALLPSLINKATQNAVIQAVIVDSTSSQRYNDWAGQQSIENYYQQYFYAWNLTNPEEFLNGSIPIFETVGPFNYKYEFIFSNVSFQDGGNLATYTQTKSYIYQADMSPNDPTQVMITNINPAYLGLMYQLAPNAEMLDNMPAENLLIAIGGCGQMRLFIEYLSSDNFTEIVYFTQNPQLYQEQYTAILKSLQGNEEYFYQQWANSTTTPTQGNGWNGMLVSSSNDGVPSNITLSSAQLLFNSSNENSILNEQIGQTLWINALLGDKASITVLTSELQLSTDQIDLILKWWLNDFSQVYTVSHVCDICDIEDLSLLGVCQFVTGNALNGRSISNYTFLTQQFTEGPIEIPLLYEYIGVNFKLSVSVEQAFKTLFNESDENSILNLNGMVNFITAVKSFNTYEQYNITIFDAGKILGYSTAELYERYTKPTILDLYEKYGGLIVTRTMDEWLWTCEDGILDFLGVDQPCALQQNNTVNKPSTIFTGQQDLSMTNQIFEFQEQTFLSCWNGSVEVEGFTESGQFPPLQSDPPLTMTLFEENVIRPVQLVLSGDSQVQGINTKRYYLVNDSFPVSTTFKTTIPGLVNLTDIQNLPIYVSLWDMYEVPPEYSSNNLQGLNQTYESASVPLDLEPITGNALYYNLKLQVNLAIPEYSNWFSSETSIYKKIKSNVFYPVLKIGQTATPSQSNIDLLNSQFKLIKILGFAPVIVVSVVGGIILIAGISMFAFGFKKLRQQKQQGYHAIINSE